MLRKLMAAALATAAIAVVGAPALAQPAQACFYITQWNGWKAPDDHTLYLNISNGKIVRLDLAGSCPEIRDPDARLINDDRGGSGQLCSPLDWDLRVSDGPPGGIATPCIVKGMTLLTPDEAAAIPKNMRP
jgi:hypothetical protein